MAIFQCIFWTALAIVVDLAIGTFVLDAIDDEHHSLFYWLERCPIPGGGQFLVLI